MYKRQTLLPFQLSGELISLYEANVIVITDVSGYLEDEAPKWMLSDQSIALCLH